MKAKQIASCAAWIMLGASAAAAQTTTTDPAEPKQPAAPTATSPIAPGAPSATSSEQFAPRQMPGQLLASDYMSMGVYGPNNERVGDINNIVFDENGRIVAVIVGVGGFMGLGEKAVALPYNSVKLSPQGNSMTINHTKAQLEGAPPFVTARTDQTGGSSTSQTGGSSTSGSNPKK